MSWLSVFFKKETTKVFLGLILKAVKLFLGNAAEEIMHVVKFSVEKAEKSGKSGTEKWQIAYDDIRVKLGEISVPEWCISLLIEAFVGVMKNKS